MLFIRDGEDANGDAGGVLEMDGASGVNVVWWDYLRSDDATDVD